MVGENLSRIFHRVAARGISLEIESVTSGAVRFSKVFFYPRWRASGSDIKRSINSYSTVDSFDSISDKRINNLLGNIGRLRKTICAKSRISTAQDYQIPINGTIGEISIGKDESVEPFFWTRFLQERGNSDGLHDRSREQGKVAVMFHQHLTSGKILNKHSGFTGINSLIV